MYCRLNTKHELEIGYMGVSRKANAHERGDCLKMSIMRQKFKQNEEEDISVHLLHKSTPS